jgi:hypothetical protein
MEKKCVASKFIKATCLDIYPLVENRPCIACDFYRIDKDADIRCEFCGKVMDFTFDYNDGVPVRIPDGCECWNDLE